MKPLPWDKEFPERHKSMLMSYFIPSLTLKPTHDQKLSQEIDISATLNLTFFQILQEQENALKLQQQQTPANPIAQQQVQQ
jgi:hypothetical protein